MPAEALIVQLAKAVEAELAAKKAANAFVDGTATFNSFIIERSYIPLKDRESLSPNGTVYVVGLDFDVGPSLSKTHTTQLRIPIQVGIQWPVNPTDTALLDKLVFFSEQVRAFIREMAADGKPWQWQQSDALKDPIVGLPMNYTGLREGGMFEAYSTNFFLTTVQ